MRMSAERMKENWFILFTLVAKQSQVCNVLCSQGINAFVPMMEYYRRDSKGIAVKPMFPGYVFVRAEMEQGEFDQLLYRLEDQKDGLIKQLKEEGAAAMREEEVEYFSHLLDKEGVARMSYAYLRNGKAVVTEGPLIYYQEHIVKVDKHNRVAYLDLEFMKRRIETGLEIQQKEKQKEERQNSNRQVKQAGEWERRAEIEGQTIDLEDLKSRMMGL